MKLIKPLRFLILAILVSFALVRLSPHFSDFVTFTNLVGNINWLWVVAALGSQVGQYIGDGWLSQILLAIINFKLSFKDTLRVASLSVFSAHLLPVGEAGALATTFYFYRKLGVEPEGIIFLSIAWGVFTNTVIFVMFLISLFFLPKIVLPIHPSLTGVFLVLLILFILVGVVVKRKFFLLLGKKLVGRYKWSIHIFKFFSNGRLYVRMAFSKPHAIVIAVLATLIYYFSNIATLAFSFLAVGSLPPLSLLTFAYALSLFSALITLAPAGLGASEATLLLIFLHAGIKPATAIAAILLFRLISFWIPIPTGFASYMSLKNEVSK